MDLLETVGARMVLIGQREYVAGLAEANAALDAMSTSAKATVAPSEQMSAATVKNQAAQKELAAAMKAAVSAQMDYNASLRAGAEAEALAAAGSEEFAAAKRAEAEAATAAALAIRDAALVEVQAAAESAAAASTAAAEVAAAEERKVAAAEAGAKGMKAAALGVAAIGAVVTVASVKMAADFQQSTERLVTSAGEAQSNLDLVRQGILQMAGEVGYSAEALSTAMYKVESGGQHGAAGLDVLKAAAQGAKTENADLTVVADALTSVLQDYHLKASDSADVTSKLVAATSQGKMTFEELSGSLSSVLPIASANHVALEDILGDLASMTVHGMSAQQATQNLSDVIKHMAAPTQVQAKELAALGINAQQLSSDLGTKGLSGTLLEITTRIQQGMGQGAQKVIVDLQNALKGLPGPVQDLGRKLLDGSISLKDYMKAAKDLDPISASQATSFKTLATNFYQVGTQQVTGMSAMQSYSDALRRATGDATGLNVALMLTGDNTSTTTNDIDVIRNATKDASGDVKGWTEIQETLNVKLSQAGSALGSLAISIGTYLLPPLTVLVGWIADGATWLSQHQTVALVLAGVLGGIMVASIVALTVAFYGWASSALAVTVAGAPLWAIMLAIIAVVAVVAAGAYLIINNWGPISAWFVSLWETIKGAFVTAWTAIGTAASWLWDNVLSPVFSAIGLALRILIAVVWTVLVTPFVIAWNILAAIVTAVWQNNIKPGFEGIGIAAKWLYENAIKPAWDGISSAITTAWNWINTNVFAPIKLGLTLMGIGFQVLWNTYVVPVWQGIQNAIGTAWNWIKTNVFTPIGTAVTLMGIGFQVLWNTYVTPVWNGIKDAIGTAWNWIKTNVFDPIGVALKVLGQAFDDAQKTIGTVWDKVRDAVATPIHWVVDVVYTHGIKAVWDGVADFVGLGHLPDAPAFAGGGVIGGYAPGRDTVPAMLSPGEAVMVPEFVAAVGPQQILQWNAAFSGRPATVVGQFAGGGVVGSPAPVAGGNGGGGIGSTILGWLGSAVGSIGDFLSDPVGKIKSWLGGVITGAEGAASSPIAQMLVKIPGKAVDGLVQKIVDWWNAMLAAAAAALGGGGGAVGSAPAAVGGNAALVQAMAAARGWTGPQWDALYAVVMRESGFRNNAQNPTSTAYGMFQFLDSTWGAYGASKTSDPTAQTTAGLNYIASRYGSPAGALAHEQQYGWYSGGGLAPPLTPRADGGPVTAGQSYVVGERGPELFVPTQSGVVVSAEDTSARRRAGDGAGGPMIPGSTVVHVHPGAVVLNKVVNAQEAYEAVKQGISDAVARR